MLEVGYAVQSLPLKKRIAFESVAHKQIFATQNQHRADIYQRHRNANSDLNFGKDTNKSFSHRVPFLQREKAAYLMSLSPPFPPFQVFDECLAKQFVFVCVCKVVCGYLWLVNGVWWLKRLLDRKKRKKEVAKHTHTHIYFISGMLPSISRIIIRDFGYVPDFMVI